MGMLVNPSLRGAGVAKVLLENFKMKVESLGQTCMMGVATDLGLPVYLKRGYKPVPADSACSRVSAKCEIAAKLVKAEDIQVEVHSEPASVGSNLMSLLSLDTEATGLDRASVLTNLSRSTGACVAVANQGKDVIGAC